MIKDNSKFFIALLSLASVIIILNNCGDYKSNNNFEENNIEYSDQDDSIFSRKSHGVGENKNREHDSKKTHSNIKRTSERIDVDLFIQTMDVVFGLIDRSSKKEDLVDLLKNSGVALTSPQHIDGLVDKVTIKTRRVFNGMKHIRATFVSNNGEDERLMRFTYDLPKSETALIDTALMLENTFSNLKRESLENSNQYLITYYLGEYEMTLRQNFWDDLEGNPFNPYTEDHIGTVTVSLEYRVH